MKRILFSFSICIFCFFYSLHAGTQPEKIYLQPECIHFLDSSILIDVKNDHFFANAVHTDAKGLFVLEHDIESIWDKKNSAEWKICNHCLRKNHKNRTYCYACGR